jgi:hypothetical protein
VFLRAQHADTHNSHTRKVASRVRSSHIYSRVLFVNFLPCALDARLLRPIERNLNFAVFFFKGVWLLVLTNFMISARGTRAQARFLARYDFFRKTKSRFLHNPKSYVKHNCVKQFTTPCVKRDTTKSGCCDNLFSVGLRTLVIVRLDRFNIGGKGASISSLALVLPLAKESTLLTFRPKFGLSYNKVDNYD